MGDSVRRSRCCYCIFMEPPIRLRILSRNSSTVCSISMRGARIALKMYIFLYKTMNTRLIRGRNAASGSPGEEQYSDVSNGVVFIDPRDRGLGGFLTVRISLAWRVSVKKMRNFTPNMAIFMPYVNSGRRTSFHERDEDHYSTTF